MDEFTGELKNLMAAYRQSLPDPEPSAQFMPGVWRRIEGRKTSGVFLRRLTEGFVAAAVVMVLVVSMLISSVQPSPMSTTAYVDVLAASQGDENAAFAEVFHPEPLQEASVR